MQLSFIPQLSFKETVFAGVSQEFSGGFPGPLGAPPPLVGSEFFSHFLISS